MKKTMNELIEEMHYDVILESGETSKLYNFIKNRMDGDLFVIDLPQSTVMVNITDNAMSESDRNKVISNLKAIQNANRIWHNAKGRTFKNRK